MAGIEITDICLARDSREGIRFAAVRKGERHDFVVSREALDDLKGGNTQGDEKQMREAFEAHSVRIRAIAAKALDHQTRQPAPDGWIVLQSKDF